jgi:hypothetical protein
LQEEFASLLFIVLAREVLVLFRSIRLHCLTSMAILRGQVYANAFDFHRNLRKLLSFHVFSAAAAAAANTHSHPNPT